MSQEGEFVQDFRERRELIALEGFVEYFRAGGRIVDALDVVIGIFVKVVIFQEDVSTRDDAYVAVEIAADAHSAGRIVSGTQFFGCLQHDAVAATHMAIDTHDAHSLKMTSGERVLIAFYEIMLAQPTVVD